MKINKIKDKSITIIFNKEIDGPTKKEIGIKQKKHLKKLSLYFSNIIKYGCLVIYFYFF